MSLRAPHERVASFRSRRDGPVLAAVRDRLADCCAENLARLTEAEPPMPVEGRAANTWEPLIAIADAAEGHWPGTARAVCLALVNAAQASDKDQSSRLKLLANIRDIFADHGDQFIATADLIVGLHDIDGSP